MSIPVCETSPGPLVDPLSVISEGTLSQEDTAHFTSLATPTTLTTPTTLITPIITNPLQSCKIMKLPPKILKSYTRPTSFPSLTSALSDNAQLIP